ncbi:YggS family pyridoxal phosphate-dependent enzyme [Rubrobacter aplysinae]|uniref:YggS family pyridoxal phosphate-dependent enzyme n=1 Tax=Rubrobacter aplysinae TaxID=909625 RepID=UPI00069F300F|nr:YggS family pyridoxal phosphate-dependent enzyme [Rubrobacter aplysinae]
MEVTDEVLRDRLSHVGEEMRSALERSGRGGSEARMLVASKYYTVEQVSMLRDAGVTLLGENKSEDLAYKQDRFGDDFEWHFIGHLQRRKAKDVVPRVSLIHSVDSERLIEELAKRVPEAGVSGTEVLLQVNVSGEEAKYGVGEDEVERLLETAASTEGDVRVRGFMTVAPQVEDPGDVRYVFAKLRAIRDSLRGEWAPHFDLSELSMGMSGDYRVALEEGATLLRVGRTLIERRGT